MSDGQSAYDKLFADIAASLDRKWEAALDYIDERMDALIGGLLGGIGEKMSNGVASVKSSFSSGISSLMPSPSAGKAKSEPSPSVSPVLEKKVDAPAINSDNRAKIDSALISAGLANAQLDCTVDKAAQGFTGCAMPTMHVQTQSYGFARSL